MINLAKKSIWKNSLVENESILQVNKNVLK